MNVAKWVENSLELNLIVAGEHEPVPFSCIALTSVPIFKLDIVLLLQILQQFFFLLAYDLSIFFLRDCVLNSQFLSEFQVHESARGLDILP